MVRQAREVALLRLVVEIAEKQFHDPPHAPIDILTARTASKATVLRDSGRAACVFGAARARTRNDKYFAVRSQYLLSQEKHALESFPACEIVAIPFFFFLVQAPRRT